MKVNYTVVTLLLIFLYNLSAISSLRESFVTVVDEVDELKTEIFIAKKHCNRVKSNKMLLHDIINSVGDVKYEVSILPKPKKSECKIDYSEIGNKVSRSLDDYVVDFKNQSYSESKTEPYFFDKEGFHYPSPSFNSYLSSYADNDDGDNYSDDEYSDEYYVEED